MADNETAMTPEVEQVIDLSALEVDKQLEMLMRLLTAARAAVVLHRNRQILYQEIATLESRTSDLRTIVQRLEQDVLATRGKKSEAEAEVRAAARAEQERLARELDRARGELVGVRREREEEQNRRRDEDTRARDERARREREGEEQKRLIAEEVAQAKRHAAEVQTRLRAEQEVAERALEAVKQEQAAIIAHLQAVGQSAAAARH